MSSLLGEVQSAPYSIEGREVIIVNLYANFILFLVRKINGGKN